MKRWHTGYKIRFRNIARACRDTVRKASAHLKFSFARDVKGTRRNFYCYVSCKRMNKENARNCVSTIICVKATSGVWICKTFCGTDGEL